MCLLCRDDNIPDDVVPKYWGNRGHREDILCLAHCEPNVLVSASYDGDIIVWDVDGEKKVVRMNAYDEASRNGTQLIHSHHIHKKSMDTKKQRTMKANLNLTDDSSLFSTATKCSTSVKKNSPTSNPSCQQVKYNLTTSSTKRLKDTATAANSNIPHTQMNSEDWDKSNLSFTDRAVEKVSVCSDNNILNVYNQSAINNSD